MDPSALRAALTGGFAEKEMHDAHELLLALYEAMSAVPSLISFDNVPIPHRVFGLRLNECVVCSRCGTRSHVLPSYTAFFHTVHTASLHIAKLGGAPPGRLWPCLCVVFAMLRAVCQRDQRMCRTRCVFQHLMTSS